MVEAPANVNALAVPSPEAVMEYPLVAVLLQTHTFWANDAALAGSWLVKATSTNPEILARAGTEAEIETVPVEVAPKVPWVAALALGMDAKEASESARTLPARLPRMKDLIAMMNLAMETNSLAPLGRKPE